MLLDLLSLFRFTPTRIAFVILMLFSQCGEKNLISPKEFVKLSFDEALPTSKSLTKKKQAEYLYKYVIGKINTRKNKDSIDYILEVMGSSEFMDENPYMKNYLLQAKGFYDLNYSGPEKALPQLRQALHQAKQNPDLDILEAYHNLSVCFYYTENMKDSALHYWRIAYKEAEFRNDSLKVFLFSSNLGAYYYGIANYATARKMFTRATQIATLKKLNSAVLRNNIVSTLTNQNKYSQALEYWAKHKEILKINYTTYYGQLFATNRANLLQLADRYDEAKPIVDKLITADINPTLKKESFSVIIRQQLHDENFNFFKDSTYQQFISTNSLFLTRLRSFWITSHKRPEINSFYTGLEKSFIENENDSNNTYRLAAAAQILGHRYKISNPSKALTFFEKAARIMNDGKAEDNRRQARNITEITDLEETFLAIYKKESIIKQQEQRQQNLYIAIIGLGVILVLAISIFFNRIKLKNSQKEIVETEKKSLEKEKELNNRMVEYSKVVIANTQQLKKQLALIIPHAAESIAQQIQMIQRELDSISRISPENNPKVAEQIIEENTDLESKYPGFSNLNKTEKRVFALWKENYNSKDIASLLNMSTQYVRNVKSRIRKKVTLPEEWT